MTVTVDRLSGARSLLAYKAPVKVATTTNITLSGTQTIDSVAVAVDDRVLVKDQADTTENGIYEVQTGAWRRAADFNLNRDLTHGTRVWDANQEREYVLSTTGDIDVGTSSIVFEVVFRADDYATAAAASAAAAAASAEILSDLVTEGADGAALVSTRAALRALDTSSVTLAMLSETISSNNVIDGVTTAYTTLQTSNWQWNPSTPTATHQADRFERDYIAPDSGAAGAWERISEEIAAPTRLDQSSSKNVSASLQADRERVPVWPWLADPSVVDDGFTAVVLPNASAPYLVVQNGGKWYEMSGRSEVTPWWRPEGASGVFDFANSRFWWDGATRAIGDLTGVTVSGESRYRLDGLDLSIESSQEYTVLLEYVMPATHELSGSQFLFSMTDTGVANNRSEFSAGSAAASTAGLPSLFHARPSGSSATYTPRYYFGGTAGSFRPMMNGRTRVVYSVKPGEAAIYGMNGYPVIQSGTSVSGTISINRLGFGYRALNATEDAPTLSDDLFNSLRVVIWPYAMTAEQVERAIDHSEQGLLPQLWIMDSYGFDPGINDSANFGAGVGIPGKFKANTSSDGYRSVSCHWHGNTAWYRASSGGAGDSFLDKLATVHGQANWSERYRRYVHVFIDGGHDESADLIQSGILAALEYFDHDRWVYNETVYGADKPIGNINRTYYDVETPITREWCGPRFIALYDAMRALSSGNSTLAAEITAGLPDGLTAAFAGSAATFAALPSAPWYGGSLSSGMGAILTADDGGNSRGFYIYNGSAWVFSFALGATVGGLTSDEILDSVADALGTWPKTALEDAIHADYATGNPTYAATVEAKLDALGYTSGGQFL